MKPRALDLFCCAGGATKGLLPPHDCDKSLDRDLVTVTKHGPPARWYKRNPGRTFNIKTWHDAMGIDWMDRNHLTQAIPPAYSEFIGQQVMQVLQSRIEATA